MTHKKNSIIRLSGALADFDSAVEACDRVTAKRLDAATKEALRRGLIAAFHYELIADIGKQPDIIQADHNRVAGRVQRAVYVIELLCRPKDRAALIGDLLEAYDDVLETQGERRANIWLRVQVFWTALSCLGSRLRSLPGIAAIGLAVNWIGHKISF